MPIQAFPESLHSSDTVIETVRSSGRPSKQQLLGLIALINENRTRREAS